MTTSSTTPSTNPQFTLPTQASHGFSNAPHYDKHRQSYPAQAISEFLQHLEIANQQDARVVEIGAGTGKFTEMLTGRDEGFEIIAVEPHPQMRETLKEKELKGVTVLDGDAAHLPIEEGWGDACVAAQAFHWFATKETLDEISRVLRPGAVLGMIWNVEEYNWPYDWPTTTEWQQRLKNIIKRLDDGLPRFRDMKWKDVFENQIDHRTLQTLRDPFHQRLTQFSLPLGQGNVKWSVWLTEDGLWARYETLSQIANLEPAQKEEVKKEVFEALKGSDVERNAEGEILVQGMTYFAWTSKV